MIDEIGRYLIKNIKTNTKVNTNMNMNENTNTNMKENTNAKIQRGVCSFNIIR